MQSPASGGKLLFIKDSAGALAPKRNIFFQQHRSCCTGQGAETSPSATDVLLELPLVLALLCKPAWPVQTEDLHCIPVDAASERMGCKDQEIHARQQAYRKTSKGPPAQLAERVWRYAGSQHDFSAALGTYPPAQASHQAVVADRQLFMRTLRQLHDQLGTQFRIPMVSGRELDVHLLYKQVRTRI